ncbi:TVP38/TMEM64 family protein [Proteinivorax hydrogeniformans]|uniref:TVP38/TMEM64 family membrane protein n=1 Tax=Proteinivorax hydrogeniformans TaxID=1826727 RepID=A0AAU8HRI8_9FIRM
MKKFINKFKYAIVLSIIFIFALYVISHSRGNMENLTEFFYQQRTNPWTPFIYIFVYVSFVLISLPASALTLLAGPLFGFFRGLIYVLIGFNLSAHLCFIIARKLGKEKVEKFIDANGKIKKYSDKIGEHGFMVMLYLRLIPIFPYALLNYVSGLSVISFKEYALATFLGKLPFLAVMVYFSTSVADAKENPLGVVISIALMCVMLLFVNVIRKKTKIVE